MGRQEAATRAVDAADVALAVIDSYGLDSDEALRALAAANAITTEAEGQGCTAADYDQARRARG